MMYTLEYMNRELPTLKVKEVISKHGLDTQAQTQTQVVMVGSGSLQTIILMQIIMMNTKPILELLSHQQEHTIMQVGFPLMVGLTYKYGGYSSDGGGLWDGSTYVSGVLTINANVAPVLTDISNQTMTEDNSLSLNIAATDADNDQLTYTITGGSSETVSASIDGTTLTLTPASNYFTTTALNFVLKVADTFGDSDTSQFSVTVTAVNDAPVIASLSDQEGSEGVEITFNITATDVDGDDLTWSSANLPSGAVFTDNDNGTSTFTWTPNYTQAGVYTNITFIVDDGQGSTASMVVNPKKDKLSN